MQRKRPGVYLGASVNARELTFTNIEQAFELLDAVHTAGVAGLSSLSQPEAQALLERIHRRYQHPHPVGSDARS